MTIVNIGLAAFGGGMVGVLSTLAKTSRDWTWLSGGAALSSLAGNWWGRSPYDQNGLLSSGLAFGVGGTVSYGLFYWRGVNNWDMWAPMLLCTAGAVAGAVAGGMIPDRPVVGTKGRLGGDTGGYRG